MAALIPRHRTGSLPLLRGGLTVSRAAGKRATAWSQGGTSLSGRRRDLVRPVLERPAENVLLSLRGLARKLQSDPATLLRAIRAIGFGSYADFRAYLHELSLTHATSLDVVRRATRLHGPARLSETLTRDFKNLQTLQHGIDAKRVTAVANRMHGARRILVLGGDLVESLVSYLEYNLIALGFPAVPATSPGKIVHSVRDVGRKDVVIAISFRRGLRQTVEGLMQARANGAYCVAITNTLASPLVRIASEFFLAPIEVVPLAVSYTAPMACINVLLAACFYRRRARSIALLKKAAQEERTGFRWYDGS
jgi:DNA-binding MurR/RpiR family transcriptional regulator